jgi:starch-binding outer membrane protein, SusD/RagB family
MKKYKYILPFLFVVLFTACSKDNLEIPQKGVISIDAFYITDADAQSALTTAYSYFHQNIGGNAGIYNAFDILFNYCSDNILAAGEFYGDNDYLAAVNEFRYDAQNEVVKNMYQKFYYAIYRSNLVIDNFAYGESTVKDRCISEARVLRAWCHMMLAMAWDSPPLIEHVLTGSAKPGNYTKGHDALLQWCADEAADAVQYLDERKSTTDKDGAVKVTKGFAWTVQGKALLYKKDYTGAKTALKNVITSGKYDLVSGANWANLFHIEGDGSAEKIFELNVILNSNLSATSRTTWMEANLWGWRTSHLAGTPTIQALQGWGGLGIEENFANEFAANDGDSYRRKSTMLTYNEFITGIAYPNDASVPTTALKLADPKRGISYITGNYGQGAYLQRKFMASLTDIMQTKTVSYRNYIIERYADVLLMYAEACAQTADADGLQYLQKVQQRAGSAHVSSALTLADVKKERNYELWCEGSRWIDMNRWGELDKAKTAGKNIPSLVDAFFSLGEAAHRGYVTHSEPNASKTVGFVAGKHEYFPYPYSETSINPNIVQNPGWK